MLETGLDNELMTLDTGLENSAMAAEGQEAGTYWVITSRAKGGANNPFGGSANANQTSQLVQMTEQQVRQEYEDSGQLQQQFGSFDNYMGYVNESQEWIQTADWMRVTPEYSADSKEGLFLAGEDIAWGPGERERIQEKIIQDRLLARQNAFQDWLGNEEGQALMQKWGIQPVIYNNDGDQFKWTGSGYQKTIKVDDHAGLADYVKAVLTSVVVGGVTGQLINAAYGAVAPLVGAQHGMAGKILGTIFSTSGGATAGGIAYEDAMDALNNPNVIVNLNEGLNGSEQGAGPDMTPPKKDINDDGTRTYGSYNLPPGYIYNDVRGVVIHEETGEEYPVEYTVYGSEGSPYNWIVNLPVDDADEDGGAGDSTASSSNSSDTNSSNTGSNTNSQYEVIRKNDDGTVVIRDNVDGDIWILAGDYEEGDYVPESDMGGAVNGNGALDNNGSNTTIAGTSGTGTTPTPATPTPPAPIEGDACDLGGGNTGVIKDGKCVATTATLPNTGMWPASTSPDSTSTPPSDSNTGTTTTQAPSTTPTTAPSTTPSPSNQPAGEIVGTGVWPASGTGGGTGAGNGPEGSGDGNGGGDGDGDGGNGDGNGNGLSNLAASRGSSKAHWDRLFAAKEFQSRRGQFGRPTGTSRELNSSNYQMRQNLMNSLWDDLA